MVAVSSNRVKALISWINGFSRAAKIEEIKALQDVWKRHLLTLCMIIESGGIPSESDVCRRTNAAEAFDEALYVLQGKAAYDKNPILGCLDAPRAAKGSDTEIYKFVVLIISKIFVADPEKMTQLMTDRALEQPLAELLDQAFRGVEDKDKTDEWWRTEPLTPKVDSPLPKSDARHSLALGMVTPLLRRQSGWRGGPTPHSARVPIPYEEENLSPLRDVLNSPRNSSFRAQELRTRLDLERERNKESRERESQLEFELDAKDAELKKIRQEKLELITRLEHTKDKQSYQASDLSTLSGQLDRVEKEKDALERELAAARQQALHLQDEAVRREESVRQLEAECASLATRRDDLHQQLQAAEEVTAELREDVRLRCESLHQERANVAQLERELASTHRKMDAMEAECAEKMEQLTRRVAEKDEALELQSAELQSEKLRQMEFANTMREDWECKEADLLKELDRLRSSKETHEKSLKLEIAQLTSALSHLRDRQSCVEGQREADEARLHVELEAARGRINELTEQLVEANRLSGELRSQVRTETAAYKMEVSTLKDDVLRKNLELSHLNPLVEELRRSLAEKTTAIDSLEAAKLSHTEEMAAMYAKNRELERELSEKSTHLRRTQFELDSHFKRYCQMENAFEQFRQEGNLLFAQKVEGLQAEIVRLNTELETVKRESAQKEERAEMVEPEEAEPEEDTAQPEEEKTASPEPSTPTPVAAERFQMLADCGDEEPEVMEFTSLKGETSVMNIVDSSNATVPDHRDSFANQSMGNVSLGRGSQCSSTSFLSRPSFEPRATDRDRIAELNERNARQPPALRSSYFSETMDYGSPSGSEMALKGANAKEKENRKEKEDKEKKTPRRKSSVFGLFKKDSKSSLKSNSSDNSNFKTPVGLPPKKGKDVLREKN